MTGKPLGNRSTFHTVAAELKRTASTDENSTLYRRAFRNRKVVHIRAERRRILIRALAARVVRHFRHIALRPQIDGRSQRILLVIPTGRRRIVIRTGKRRKLAGLTVNRSGRSRGIRPDIISRTRRKSRDVTSERVCIAGSGIMTIGHSRIVGRCPADTELRDCFRFADYTTARKGIIGSNGRYFCCFDADTAIRFRAVAIGAACGRRTDEER